MLAAGRLESLVARAERLIERSGLPPDVKAAMVRALRNGVSYARNNEQYGWVEHALYVFAHAAHGAAKMQAHREFLKLLNDKIHEQEMQGN